MVPVQPRPAAFLCLAPQQERQALLLDPGTLLGPPLSGKPWSPGIIPVLGAGRESLLTIAQSHQTGCADPLGKKKKEKHFAFIPAHWLNCLAEIIDQAAKGE